MFRLDPRIAEIIEVELCNVILHLGYTAPECHILGKLFPSDALFFGKRMLSVDHKAMVVADRACLAYLVVENEILRQVEYKIDFSAA